MPTVPAARVVMVAVAMAMLVVSGLPVAQAAPDPAATVLRPGHPWFHDEEPVDRAAVVHPGACDLSGLCWEYALEVAEPVWRLRVALAIAFPSPDHVRPNADPLLGPAFELVVTAPDGTTSTVKTGTSAACPWCSPKYHNELLWTDPPVGTWRLRVVPVAVEDLGFRLRAAVELEPPPPATEELLLPDLRSVPPFEISFMAPTATYGPGLPAPSPRLGCMAEEVEQAVADGAPPPRACLRASLGVENAGEGPLLLLHQNCVIGACMGDVPVTQRAYISDPHGAEPPYWRCCSANWPAGVGRWHASHLHLHYEGMYAASLFRVEDAGGPAPTLEPVSAGHKIGFGPFDEWMADWHRITQGPFDCCWRHGSITMSAGWGDIYEWNRSGNYVDFPVDDLGRPHPGTYLLRGETDPLQRIAESDEGNNRSYALVTVEATGQVQIAERGYGDDAWDPAKRVIGTAP